MNKSLLIIIILFIATNLFCTEKNDEKESSNFIKRTILILPFLNANNVIEYDYLSEILNDTLKSELLKTELFNFTVPLWINKKIKESGLTKKELLSIDNAKNFALKLQADVFIIGKYVIIEKEIMIIIQAYDIFTGQLAVSTNIKGSLGIDIFRVIEDASKDMANKMAQKLQMVKKSYFTEMSKLIQQEYKLRRREQFPVTRKVGIGLTAGGSTLILAGLPIMIYDLAVYYNVVKYYKEEYEKGNLDDNPYKSSLNIFTGLLVLGITTLAVGVIIDAVGIPLIIYKKKDKKVSFNLGLSNNNIVFAFSYKF